MPMNIGYPLEYMDRRIKQLDDYIETRKTTKRMLDACLKLKIAHVVDIGANHGALYRRLRAGNYQGHYTAVEPHPICANELRAMLKQDPKTAVFEVAVSNSSGTAILNADPQADVLSSLNLPSQDMNKGIDLKPSFPVDVVTTDDLLDKCSPDPDTRFMLKIDTQGHDYSVLQGLHKSWERVHVIMAELSAIPLYEEQGPHWLVQKELADHGFVPIRFQPITRRREKDVVLIAEYDGVFVRR